MGVPESIVLGLLVGIFIGAITRMMIEAMKPGSPGEHG